ncbi:MAG: TIR domain-containing protein [Chlorobium sp.]|nr:TIR domain-containing protein [Chlorobium sp.]
MHQNPFYLRVLPIDAPFCGRKNELLELLSHAKANSNVVLYSPRRYGKTSLVKRVQNRLDELGFITIYIDISDASSSEDVASMIARGIYSSLAKEQSVLSKVTGIIRNWRPVFSPDPSASGGVSMTVQPVSQKTGLSLLEETMDSFSRLLQDRRDQFNIVIDEFQEITAFRDGSRIEALLRKHIQQQTNCSYFFLGSRRRMLLDMFNQNDRPFYKSSINLELPALADDEAADFIIRQFNKGGKECPVDIAKEIATITEGYPYYIQRLSYALFQVSPNEDILPENLRAALRKMLAEEENNFTGMEKALAPGQKPLLKALAADPTESLFSADYQQKHRLRTLSSIQNGLKKLESLDYVEKDSEGVYRLTDPIFALWINSKNSDTLSSGTITLQGSGSRSIGQTRKEENVGNALKRGYSEITGYRSEEAVEIKAKPAKPLIKLFLSYAHKDKKQKKVFFDLLNERLQTSDEYYFSFSSDSDLLVGETWHNEIRKMIESCDFGLLLLSTSFLASSYIEEHELPNLLDKCLPVALDILDLERQNLKGLNEKQIFFFNGSKSFTEVRENNRTRFIHELAAQIENRIKKQRSTEKTAEESELICCDPLGSFSDRLLKYRAPNYMEEKFVCGDGTPSQISHNPDDSKKGDTVIALDYLKSWALDSDVPYFALLGDFGTGKTFTCRMLTRELIALHEKEPDTCPLCIYIDLRMVSTRVGAEKKSPKLTDILQEAIENTKDPLDRSMVTPEHIIQLVRQNKAMIIYDGLDEKTVHFTPEETSRFVAELWSIREIRDKKGEDHQGKVLISCRTHYFRDIFEQNSLFLGRDREGRSSAEYRSCTLLPFDDSQIREYLKKNLGSDDEEIERIIGLLEEVHNLKELAGRPYALSLITGFIPDLERLQQEGKAINTARLYELTIENWLRRDEGKHEFSVAHKKRLMKALAFELHRRSGGGLSAEELEEWLDTWLFHHPVIKEAYSNMNRETLKKDLRTATFIIREEDQEFSFAHTSLQEYFLAGHLLDALTSPERQDESLAIPLPSNETLNFSVEMLALDERLLGSSIKAIEIILGNPYKKEVSELSLALWMKLHERGMKQPNPATVHLEHAELSWWKISNLNLGNACFDFAALKGTQFKRTILARSTFRKSCLINAEFLSCNAGGADFSDAEATGTVWRNSNLQDTEWLSANLRLASFVACDVIDSKNITLTPDTTVAQCTGRENTLLPESFNIDSFTGHSEGINTCALSNDNRYIISGSLDHTLKVWDFQTGSCIMTINGHSGSVNTCALSNDNRYIISGSSDKTLKVWDFQTGSCIMTLSGHSQSVSSCSVSNDNRYIVSGSHDNTLKVWNFETGSCIMTLSGHSRSVSSCSVSNDNRYIVSGSHDNTLKMWDLQTGNCIMTLNGHFWVSSCTVSQDNRYILSGSYDKTLKVWDFQTGSCSMTLTGHSGCVSSCSVSNDNRYIVSGSYDKTLKMWDLQTGSCIMTLNGHSGSVFTCAVSPNNRYIVSGSLDHTLKVWNFQTGSCSMTLTGHPGCVSSCSVSKDNRHIVSGGWFDTLRVWDFQTGNCIMTLNGHLGGVCSCVISPDNRYIVSGGSHDMTLKVWDFKTGNCIMTLNDHSDWIRSCTVSPDNLYIVSGSNDKTLKVWDFKTGNCNMTLNGHSGRVNSCAVSPNNKYIISGSDDNTLKVWDFKTGYCIMTLNGHSGRVNSCAVSPNNRYIISGSDDNTLKLWDAESGSCISTMIHLPQNQTASWNGKAQKLLSASEEAWRWIGLSSGLRRLPVELLGTKKSVV